MKNILFIGDLHLDSQTPVSRLDNYRELTLTKLRSLLELAKQHKAGHVVCTGDFFDKYDAPISYLNEVAEVFNEYKEAGVTMYSAIGNHETPYNRMEYFKNTPLSLLAKSGLVKLLGTDGGIFLEDSNTLLFGLNFTDPYDKFENLATSKKIYSILTLHYALENTVPGESVNKKDYTKFDLVVAGHDHMPYDELEYEGTTFIRPGSFIRRTKDDYNLNRGITVYKLDVDSREVEKLELPGVKPTELVFKSEILNALSSDKVNKDFEALFKEEFFKSKEQNLLHIIDELEHLVTDKTKKTIKDYVRNN